MSKAKLTHYKVTPEDLLDLIDAASCGDQFTALVRCGGGRLIANGYVCPHCGEDPSVLYDDKGEPTYQREKGKTYRRRCGASMKKVIATEDLTKLFPVHIEG